MLQLVQFICQYDFDREYWNEEEKKKKTRFFYRRKRENYEQKQQAKQSDLHREVRRRYQKDREKQKHLEQLQKKHEAPNVLEKEKRKPLPRIFKPILPPPPAAPALPIQERLLIFVRRKLQNKVKKWFGRNRFDYLESRLEIQFSYFIRLLPKRFMRRPPSIIFYPKNMLKFLAVSFVLARFHEFLQKEVARKTCPMLLGRILRFNLGYNFVDRLNSCLKELYVDDTPALQWMMKYQRDRKRLSIPPEVIKRFSLPSIRHAAVFLL